MPGSYQWGPPGPSWQLGLRADPPADGAVQLIAAVRRAGSETALTAGSDAAPAAGSDAAPAAGSDAAPAAGSDAALATGSLTLQIRDANGDVTEDGSGPRSTADLPLTDEVTEIAGWRVPAAAAYRVSLGGIDGDAPLVSGWVDAPGA
jgi:hypothetical protein